ncbi:hypothetical protein DFH11DRAFT_1549627 [Phellopilus nigrolimitatus]|nr:hypothetical protein DFH11DRAFT_1549627 [Phellopilus nigrolimitatus]
MTGPKYYGEKRDKDVPLDVAEFGWERGVNIELSKTENTPDDKYVVRYYSVAAPSDVSKRIFYTDHSVCSLKELPEVVRKTLESVVVIDRKAQEKLPEYEKPMR